MKKITALILVVLSLVSVICGCGNKGIYYDYNMTDYLTVGKYSNTVYKKSEDYKGAYRNFYNNTFGTDLSYEAKEGVVEEGDTVNINYEGYIDGEKFEGGTASNYDLTIGSGNFIEGFEDNLVGVSIGETVNLDLKFPDNYHAEDVAGKDVIFVVKVNYATKYGSPTEDNIKKYGFSSVAEYEKRADGYAANVALFYSIYDATKLTSYPKKETQVLYDNVISQYEQACKANNMTIEQFASMNGLTTEQFTEYVLEYEVKQDMKLYMVAFYVLEANKVELTQEDITKKRQELIKQYGNSLESKGYFEINIQQAAAFDKALDTLSGKADVKN